MKKLNCIEPEKIMDILKPVTVYSIIYFSYLNKYAKRYKRIFPKIGVEFCIPKNYKMIEVWKNSDNEFVYEFPKLRICNIDYSYFRLKNAFFKRNVILKNDFRIDNSFILDELDKYEFKENIATSKILQYKKDLLQKHILSIHFSEYIQKSNDSEKHFKNIKVNKINQINFNTAFEALVKDATNVNIPFFVPALYTIAKRYNKAFLIDNAFYVECLSLFYLEFNKNKEMLKLRYKDKFNIYSLKIASYNKEISIINRIETELKEAVKKEDFKYTKRFFYLLKLEGIDKETYHKIKKIKTVTYKKIIVNFLTSIGRRVYNQYRKNIITDKDNNPVTAIWNNTENVSEMLRLQVAKDIDIYYSKIDRYVNNFDWISNQQRTYFLEWFFNLKSDFNKANYYKYIQSHKTTFENIKRKILLSILN